MAHWSGRRVLVTGAGGFLGRAVCRALLARGAVVHGTQRSNPPPEGVRAHPCDLRDEAAWQAALEASRPEVVLHLASPVVLDRDPDLWPRLEQGIVAVADRVARSCLARGIRLLVTGTCEVYGDGPAPFHEGQAARPVSPYGAAKLAASQWVLALARTAGLRATVVRPFLTYGPGMPRGRLVSDAVAAALAARPFPMTDGLQVREFTYVDDMAEGLLAAAASPRAVGRLLNLGGGDLRSVRGVVRRIYELAGADPALVRPGALPRRPGEVDRFLGDHGAARALLGWRPAIDLEEGLARTVAAAREAAGAP